jgi:enamine deaminase RidA (YjgF/YER057c/UK114 family)
MTTREAGPARRGKFSAVRVVPIGTARMLFISGLTSGADPAPDIGSQTRLIFSRMRDLLAKEGAGLEHVVKITAFITDMRDYDAYNEVRNEVFADVAEAPASATVGTTQLVRPHCRIEIEAIAIAS